MLRDSHAELRILARLSRPFRRCPGGSSSRKHVCATRTQDSRLPDVNTAVIVAIVSHDFKAMDLHKLDPTNRDKETA
ncbi:hypothetical protein H2248_007914 [Termitomyces sp. 'cryptogamus']|nr:hypothetical protein H2248_007914 [Termitomyces sp. 'cryptogamus']